MNILYLSPDMSRYQGAMYQRDVMQELARQASVTFYGPGFAGFDAEDNLTEVLAKCDTRPDWIIIGHAWLADAPGASIHRWSPLSLANAAVPVAIILNKEYTNLDAKVSFARDNHIAACFSHHHDIEHMLTHTDVLPLYWPFGFDPTKFWYSPHAKATDLGFSGILQNPVPGLQGDLRAQVMHQLFECDGDIPLRLRPAFAHLRIEWNALPRQPVGPSTYTFMTDDQYSALVRRCRSFVCTRSPGNLVSTRYFECMGAGVRIISEPHPGLDRLAIHAMALELRPHDLRTVIAEALSDSAQLTAGALAALAVAEHGWDSRVRTMIRHLKHITAGSPASSRSTG